MTISGRGYLPRIIDADLETYLSLFGAILIEGPKRCGKTWAALNQAESVVYIMDPAGGYSVREAARMNPASVLGGAPPCLIDEWQEAVGIWDAVRFDVDSRAARGLYLLTGSTKPMKKTPIHSGTGRIARLRMWPMSLFESNASSGQVSLKALFEGARIAAFSLPTGLDRLIDLCVRGGWPENIAVPEKHAGLIPKQYIKQIAEADISALDDEVARDPARAMLLIKALARNVSSIVSNPTLQNDIQNGAVALSKPTLFSYLTALKNLFVLEEVPGWAPAVNARIRVQSSPKRYLVDPSLAVAGLGATAASLKRDLSLFGKIFENLCYRDICVYASAMGAKVFHYRDDTNLEVDLVIEAGGGVYAGLEVKLNPARAEEGVASLVRFGNKLAAKGGEPPAFLAVLTGGGACYTREDGVHVIPITALRD